MEGGMMGKLERIRDYTDHGEKDLALTVAIDYIQQLEEALGQERTMSEANVKFPVGGPRAPVFDFLMRSGFVMSGWSDKHWMRADGIVLHLYGSGSKARITKSNDVLADGAVDAAVAKLNEFTQGP
jgi:hypothetical protein